MNIFKHKTSIFRIIFLIAALLTSSLLFADLSDFKSNSEKEKSENSGGGGGGGDSDDMSECLTDCALDACFDITNESISKGECNTFLYFPENLSFIPYPYWKNQDGIMTKNTIDSEQKNSQIFIPPVSFEPETFVYKEGKWVPEKKENNNKPQIENNEKKLAKKCCSKTVKYKEKKFLGTMAGGYGYAFDEGSKFFGEVSVKAELLGLEISHKNWFDRKNDSLGLTSLSLIYAPIPLQIGFIEFIGGYSHFSGIMTENGSNASLRLQLFPLKPLHFSIRGGGLFFKDIQYFEGTGEVGFLYKRFELFGGYHLIKSTYAHLNSLDAGLRFWF